MARTIGYSVVKGQGLWKWALFLALSFGQFLHADAQSIYLYFTDGSTEIYPLIDVSRIDFTDDVMNLNLISGATLSWNTSVIQRYEYDDLGLSLEHRADVEGLSLNVYPNPSSGAVSITFTLKEAEIVVIDIFDMNGSNVKHSTQHHSVGTNTVAWNGTDSSGNPVQNGIYLCRVTVGNISMNRTIVITQ